MLNEPLFLVGAERSGTTMLRLMLDSHPDIAFIEEFEYATELVTADGTFPDPDEFEQYLALSRTFSTSGFTFRRDLPYPELVDGFLVARKERTGASHVGATIHYGFAKALTIWPGAKLIHLIRDPRDVACSVIDLGWAGNAWFGLDKWTEVEAEWAAIEPRLQPDRHIGVRYADLVSDHVSVLSDICEFIGTDYTEQMLDYATTTEYGVPDARRVDRWRTDLSPRDIRLAEARVGLDVMAALQFEPSGLPPISVGRSRLFWLQWHDRVSRLSARVRTFGLGLTVEDLMARALRNERWRRSVQHRYNEKSKATRKKSWVTPEPAPGSSPETSA